MAEVAFHFALSHVVYLCGALLKPARKLMLGRVHADRCTGHCATTYRTTSQT